MRRRRPVLSLPFAFGLCLSCAAATSPIRDVGSARLQLQGKVGETNLDAAKKKVESALSQVREKVSGYVSVVEATTRKLAEEAGAVRRQYVDYKRQFDELKLALDKTHEDFLAQQTTPSEEDLKKQAEEEKEAAKEEDERIKEAEEAEKEGKSKYEETLSEEAKKAVEAERERRKKEAEDKAVAEGKDPSEATWTDLTEEEIAKIADEADGLEGVTDDDIEEGEKLKNL